MIGKRRLYNLCHHAPYQIRVMQQPKQTNSRKKFLLWGSAILSSLAIFKLFPRGSKLQRGTANETVKMLTRDGRLVEIDKRLLASPGKKISDKELREWIGNSQNKIN